MPIYEYRCKTCGQRFDVLVRSIGHEPEVRYPDCQGAEAQRLISTPVVHTAGGGRQGEVAEETPRSRPPMFGRKELNEALSRKE